MTIRRPRGGQVLAAALLAVVTTLIATATPASASAGKTQDPSEVTAPVQAVEVSLL
jgi:acyl-CoA thioesterase